MGNACNQVRGEDAMGGRRVLEDERRATPKPTAFCRSEGVFLRKFSCPASA